ncbi:heterokaryon incompatibility protein-domain-containing protein [Phyllosticta citriasiana]|uniref:heterokaryon incompatibility protein-domain-containing protein n=1 Tax=Phyllosticta citriasiana TaxID=595635 RepID=UPI0030FD5894
MASMSLLCDACRSISTTALTTSIIDESTAEGEKALPGIILSRDHHSLRLSAQACDFCALVQDAFSRAESRRCKNPDPDRRADNARLSGPGPGGPVYIQLRSVMRTHDPDDRHWRYGKGLVASVHTADGVLTGNIRLFAHPDSPAFRSRQLLCTPPLPSSDCPEAFVLVQDWLQSCMLEHPRCRETLSNTRMGKLAPFLPLRVIDVAPFPASANVRIVELKNKRERYACLSHCWGHPENHPLTTTKASLPQHRRQIFWGGLPKTFQHAITVVRQLGLRYLWIDSLCIVQDDPRDWEQESKKMGDIYEKATLTIGASHASDSTEGFFWERPAPAPAVTLPYHDAAGVEQGHMYASLLPDDYRTISPEFGPLSQRAWATQEWLLSRRMLFYTRECMVWSCRTVTLRETRDTFHDTARNTRWKVVVEKYSARKLTRSEDRLIALQGLTNALQRRNRAKCILGVWDDALADQLLWFSTQPAERARSPLRLPTWTWASTIHGVRFQKASGARSMYRYARIVGEKDETDGDAKKSKCHIEVTGLLKPLPQLSPLPEMCSSEREELKISDPSLFEVLQDVEQNLASNDTGQLGAWKLTWLVSDGANQTFGWATLDEGCIPKGQVYCLAMQGLKAQERGTLKAEFRRHWVLLVVRNEEAASSDDSFVRVGVGKIIARAWFGDTRMSKVSVF